MPSRGAAVLVGVALSLTVVDRADADTEGILRYRAGVMQGFGGNAIGTGFIHGLDATLMLGSNNRSWRFALAWEMEWGCHGPRSEIEVAKLTLCFGPSKVDAVPIAVKTLGARPMLRVKRLVGSSPSYITFSTGIGLFRANTPIDGTRNHISPAGSLSYERLLGSLLISVTAHYEGPPLGPGVGWIMLGVGYSS